VAAADAVGPGGIDADMVEIGDDGVADVAGMGVAPHAATRTSASPRTQILTPA
jgi:hypothetical protein